MIFHDSLLNEFLPQIFPDHWEKLRADQRIRPASVDLTVEGPLMSVSSPKPHMGIRPGGSVLTEVPLHREPTPHWILEPGVLYLISTAERISVRSNMVAHVEGRSSWGRIGLRIHATAGYVDPGFHGKITLELDVIGPKVELRPGDSICQVSVHWTTGLVDRPYGISSSKYQGQDCVTASRGMSKGGSK